AAAIAAATETLLITGTRFPQIACRHTLTAGRRRVNGRSSKRLGQAAREAADDRAVREMEEERHERRPPAVVEEHEARRLEERRLLRVRPRRAHPRADGRE